MALLQIDRNPSPAILRWFGLIQSAALALIGGVIWWRFQAPTAAYVIWGVAAVFLVAYYAIPPARRRLYLAAMYATYPIGLVLSHVVLGLIYFGLFSLIGLLLKAVGYNPLQPRFDRKATSYWTVRKEGRPAGSYFRQF